MSLRPAKDYKNVKLLFIIDNDLADSRKIKEFLGARGHLVQFCDPNTEGMILAIAGKPQIQVVGDKDYRTRCKVVFSNHFGCDAHKLKEADLGKIFKTEKIVQESLPILFSLFRG